MVTTQDALHAVPTGPDGRPGLRVGRYFTSEGTHPYDELEWERRDAVINDWRTGEVAFEQRGVEFPSSWSMNATTIVAQKYFRGMLGTAQREHSVRQMIDRVTDTIGGWGRADGYFADDGAAATFADELKHLLVNQKAAFNSPVWFNVGVEPTPQCSACFILSVEDTMSSILNWYVEEGTIFKGGSGSGVNLSRIRGSMEPLKGGGQASGPVSFMRGADASAGTIKCLHRDTEVVTDSGVVRVGDVRPGSRVLTRHGLKRVEAVHDNGRQPLVKVRTALGDEILCTPEHRFRVRGVDGESWRQARDLRSDDHVMVDLEATQHGALQPLTPVAPGHHNEIEHELPEVLDEAVALFLGWVYGDGSVASRPSAKFIALRLGDADPELVGRYTALVKTVFGERAHLFLSRHRDRPDVSVSVRFSSSQVIRFLQTNGLGKGTASDLRVPSLIKSSPATVRAAFASGVFEADGHVGNGYPTLSTVSEAFARDMHRLLLSIGIPSKLGSIRDRRTALGQDLIHTVRVLGGPGVRRFAKLVGFLSERKSRHLESAVERKNASPFEASWVLPHVEAELDAVWRRSGELYVTVTVEPAGRGPTVDLTVEDVHEYLVHNVATHNSGGKTRRAAKMVVLDVDHPDVEEFIWCKHREEQKARVLGAAGFDMDLDGTDSGSIQYQNANNSVRVTDEFMRAVERDEQVALRAVLDDRPVKTLPARELMGQIAQAAWECADPGIQYDTTINDWHTTPNAGRINASNPCSEYMHLDNSACNLASLNLRRFEARGVFDVEAFERAVEIVFLAQEIIVGNSSYPTERIAHNARRYRQLGLGYANLGSLLMSQGLAYDSDEGRAWAAAITALMTGRAYRASAEIARAMGPFDGFADDRDGMLRVIAKHTDAVDGIDADLAPSNVLEAARRAWSECGDLGARHGVRNAQASVLAPTGTIAFLLDCDTTGIEPDLGLVKTKKLVGGGSMRIVNRTVPVALERLGYQPEQIEAIVAYIDDNSTVQGAPALRPEHLPVFDCAMGERSIAPTGHLRMMSAVQPFISGAISKTVNMPESATVEDVEDMFMRGWHLGLKAIAIYRDNCKVGQPLAVTRKEPAVTTTEEAVGQGMVRRRLPQQRPSQTISFQVGDAEGYLTAGEYPGDGLGEIFVKLGKQGSTLSGVMDAFAISVSLGLQYGVPLEAYVSKFINMRFEPSGLTDDPEVRFSASLADYMFRRLAIEYLPADKRRQLGIYTVQERQQSLDAGAPAMPEPGQGDPPADAAGQTVLPVDERPHRVDDIYGDAPMCYSCGVRMQRAGSCHVCGSCGTTSGCS
ncbi:MAG: vitamin B12-dependent ribonucleotide reductase [Actinomycetota bacterium]|nr:vitamin B12-dependent ribonucleotide reductase [Actinomycetota bacterium]